MDVNRKFRSFLIGELLEPASDKKSKSGISFKSAVDAIAMKPMHINSRLDKMTSDNDDDDIETVETNDVTSIDFREVRRYKSKARATSTKC